jgi:phosphonate transport system permease protein
MNNLDTTSPPPHALETPDQVRSELLHPLRKISGRSLVIIVLIGLVLMWSLSGVGPGPANRVTSVFDPFIAMGNLIGRMLPPDYEVVNEHPVEIALFGRELVNFTIVSSEINVFGNTMRIGWLPIVAAIFETIQMALIGTLGAVMVALVLSVLAAKNTSPHPVVYHITRLILNFMRSIPELVWALLFVAAVGLGPFTGALALVFGSMGSLSRIFAEAIEQIDQNQVNAVLATGASNVQSFIYAVFPQALPLFISYSIVYFESNVRHATILGYVGAGGVGFLLFKYTGTSDYSKVLGTVIAMVIAVTIIDRFSSWLRGKVI